MEKARFTDLDTICLGEEIPFKKFSKKVRAHEIDLWENVNNQDEFYIDYYGRRYSLITDTEDKRNAMKMLAHEQDIIRQADNGTLAKENRDLYLRELKKRHSIWHRIVKSVKVGHYSAYVEDTVNGLIIGGFLCLIIWLTFGILVVNSLMEILFGAVCFIIGGAIIGGLAYPVVYAIGEFVTLTQENKAANVRHKIKALER